MKISSLLIKNFKTIKELNIDRLDNAFIVVGKNSTGKTTILRAICALMGQYEIHQSDFGNPERNIEIAVNLTFTNDDIKEFHAKGIVSKYKSFDMWYEDFCDKLPTFSRGIIEEDSEFLEYQEPEEDDYGGVLSFSFVAEPDLMCRYSDGVNKNNRYIQYVLPQIHYIDASRDLIKIQDAIFMAQTKASLRGVRDNVCIYDESRVCTRCFDCIEKIKDKVPSELDIAETVKLLEYKLVKLNMDSFMEKLNTYYTENSGRDRNIRFVTSLNTAELFKMDSVVMDRERYTENSVLTMSAGAKSIYILSLLEAYAESQNSIQSIFMLENPEIDLHPQLQKTASEILYKLSNKNQVMFSTHSPNMIFNFNSQQIHQVVLDENYHTTIMENTDINRILDDLGYSAADMMNVNFVFIVEGKQDRNRLPLLLKRYYSEVYNEDGTLQRISIISTNSCTNIKTYANLKYINQLYLKDQFMMIRDGDGKNPETLVKQLCSYYRDREKEDKGNLPRITEKNVLVLKYYSFENYFLNPKIMAKIGVIGYEEEFYDILLARFKSSLYKLGSVKRMREVTGLEIKGKEDIKRNLETIKTYVRGHNLFDIFYGRYKGEKENEILTKYIEESPRSEFADILDSIDRFIYFVNRRKEEPEKEAEPVKEKHKKKSKYNRLDRNSRNNGKNGNSGYSNNNGNNRQNNNGKNNGKNNGSNNSRSNNNGNNSSKNGYSSGNGNNNSRNNNGNNNSRSNNNGNNSSKNNNRSNSGKNNSYGNNKKNKYNGRNSNVNRGSGSRNSRDYRDYDYYEGSEY